MKKENLDTDYSKEVTPNVEKQESTFPSEVIDLPSKGLVYPKDNLLSSGQIDLRYMTTKEEDILASTNLIKKGVVIDKLLEALIVDKNINYKSLVLGDKDAIMYAARILGYGENYNTKITCQKCGEDDETTIDLSELKEKDIDYDILTPDNRYEFELPHSKAKIVFKLLTVDDDLQIEKELKYREAFNKKTNKTKDVVQQDISTRLKYLIIEVNSKSTKGDINKFVDTMLSRDSIALREYYNKIAPGMDTDINFTCSKCGGSTVVSIPLTVNFFWPNV